MSTAKVSAAILSVALLAGCGSAAGAVTSSTGPADQRSDAQASGGQGSGGQASGGQGSGGQGSGTPGSDAQQSAPTVNDQDAIALKEANLVADCMKKQGFRYVPHPTATPQPNQATRYGTSLAMLEPAEQVRTFREKYGFGIFSQFAYPNDPAVTEQEDLSQDPNDATRAELDSAQQAAWDRALDGTPGPPDGKSAKDFGCTRAAKLTVEGRLATRADQVTAARDYGRFQADPAVIAAAQKYADCLKHKGYTVSSAQPGPVADSMRDIFAEQSLADGVNASGGTVPSATARSVLPKEIKAALDDLDCSTNYATLVRTRWARFANFSVVPV